MTAALLGLGGLGAMTWCRVRTGSGDAGRHEQTVRELAETNERLRSLFEYHPHAVFSLDLAGRFVSVNDAGARTSGYLERELVGTGFVDLLVDDDRDRVVGVFAALVDRRPQRTDMTIARRDGVLVELSVTGLPIVVSEKVVGVYGIAEDVGERNRLQRDLVGAKKEADHANEAKAMFLATMSHEIRTPLTSVLAANELLGDTGLDRTQGSLVATMDRAGRRLLRLVDTILDFSRIEAGKVELDRTVLDLRTVVAEAVSLVGSSAGERGLEVTWEVDPDVPSRLLGDPMRLSHVLTNLLGNAVKFTDQGAVRVEVGLVGAAADTVEVQVAVSDSGVGLTREQQGRVFAAFSQADASVTRRHGGTGLGLAISTRLVTLMGGALRVDSAPGQGSTFSFRLPLGRAEPVDGA